MRAKPEPWALGPAEVRMPKKEKSQTGRRVLRGKRSQSQRLGQWTVGEAKALFQLGSRGGGPPHEWEM